MPFAIEPLVELGRLLRSTRYGFTTVSPATHARVNARPENATARSLRDVFGWSRPFRPGQFPAVERLLASADALGARGELLVSEVRFSSLGEALYAHSAFPTLAPDSVFFGPDTYRYAALLDQEAGSARRCVDIGCGSGAGGLHLGRRAESLILSDVNPKALQLAQVNAELQRREVEVVESDVLGAVDGPLDLVISNPPYMVDAGKRAYRDGGGPRGTALSVRIVEQALQRLSPGGRLVLYTASPIEDGVDPFREELTPLLEKAGARFRYRELDVDVWGEELDGPAYRHAERIAVVGLVAEVR